MGLITDILVNVKNKLKKTFVYFSLALTLTNNVDNKCVNAEQNQHLDTTTVLVKRNKNKPAPVSSTDADKFPFNKKGKLRKRDLEKAFQELSEQKAQTLKELSEQKAQMDKDLVSFTSKMFVLIEKLEEITFKLEDIISELQKLNFGNKKLKSLNKEVHEFKTNFLSVLKEDPKSRF